MSLARSCTRLPTFFVLRRSRRARGPSAPSAQLRTSQPRCPSFVQRNPDRRWPDQGRRPASGRGQVDIKDTSRAPGKPREFEQNPCKSRTKLSPSWIDGAGASGGLRRYLAGQPAESLRAPGARSPRARAGVQQLVLHQVELLRPGRRGARDRETPSRSRTGSASRRSARRRLGPAGLHGGQQRRGAARRATASRTAIAARPRSGAPHSCRRLSAAAPASGGHRDLVPLARRGGRCSLVGGGDQRLAAAGEARRAAAAVPGRARW